MKGRVGKILTLSHRTWIQAEYKGLKGSKRWKDWNNKKLKNIAWYDSINDSQDEPTKVIFNHYLISIISVFRAINMHI